MSQTVHSMSEQLGETVGAFMSSLPDDEAQIVGASFEKLHASHTGESAIAAGEIAPDFTLPGATGAAVTRACQEFSDLSVKHSAFSDRDGIGNPDAAIWL